MCAHQHWNVTRDQKSIAQKHNSKKHDVQLQLVLDTEKVSNDDKEFSFSTCIMDTF